MKKELSIEEKAKAYDEALERARKFATDLPNGRNDRLYHVWDLESIFPELKESEDERIRKGLINYFNDFSLSTFGGLDPKKILAWLEKQGEQKPVDEVELKFRIEAGKWYICISQYCNCIEGRCYQALCDGRIIDDFGTEYDMHSDANKYFRLWTIQDAKPGDVLAAKDTVFIFNHLDKTGLSLCKSYCEVIGNSKLGFGFEFSINSVYPATKEQSDALMKAMADAGYTFDFEKKELKKIDVNNSKFYDVNYDVNEEVVNTEELSKQNIADWSKEDSPYYDDICEILTQ